MEGFNELKKEEVIVKGRKSTVMWSNVTLKCLKLYVWFYMMYGLWICLYEVCKWYNAYFIKGLGSFHKKALDMIWSKMSLLNSCFCVVAILSAFFY